MTVAERICRTCEYYDDGTGERRTAESGDCLNRFGPRFQTKPNETCPHWWAEGCAAEQTNDSQSDAKPPPFPPPTTCSIDGRRGDGS